MKTVDALHNRPDARLDAHLDGRQRLAKGVVLLTWLLSSVFTVLFVAQHTSWVPFGDEYDIVPLVADREPLSWRWLWTPHNEHRIVLPRLVRYGLLKVAGGDFRVCVYGLPVFMSIVALGVTLSLARIRGRFHVSDAGVSLGMMHWGQVENWVWGFQWCIFLPVALTLIVLCLGMWRAGNIAPRASVIAAGCLLALLFCGGGGLLAAIPFSLWLVWATWTAYGGSATVLERGYCLAAAAMIIALWVGTAWYFHGLPPVAPNAAPSPVAMKLKVAVAFLSTLFGMQLEHYWRWTGSLAALAMVGFIAVCLRVAAVQPAERARAGVLLATVAGCVLMALAVGHGRASSGVYGGLQSRYASFMVPFLGALHFVPVVASGTLPDAACRWLRHGCLVFAVLLQANVPFGLEYGRDMMQRREAFVRDFRDGTESFLLAERYHSHPFGLYSPSAERLDKWLMMLHESGHEHFAGLRPSPAYRRLRVADIPGTQVVGAGGVVIDRRTLAAPLQVRCLSIAVQAKGSVPSQLTVRWWKAPSDPSKQESVETRSFELAPDFRTERLVMLNSEIQFLEFETTVRRDRELDRGPGTGSAGFLDSKTVGSGKRRGPRVQFIKCDLLAVEGNR